MRAQITVRRFNPEHLASSKPKDSTEAISLTKSAGISHYTVDYNRGGTLLSALLKIKAEIDGTLTFRASCRAAICGSCLMEVNGTVKLACQVSLQAEFSRYEKIDIGPMPNTTVIKDLVVDMGTFWQKIKAITPYVVSLHKQPFSTTSLKNIHEQLHHADGCIMCGACLSVCATHEVSPRFLGPAALAKAYRFMADPRDQIHTKRLELLQGEDGIWDCVRCNFCVSVCPKEVAPMEQIIRLRRLSIAAGLDQTVAARHITQFSRIVGRFGRLNETLLPILMMWGDWKKLFRMIPLGIKMFLRGKMVFPLIWHKGHKKIQLLFAKGYGRRE